MAVELARLALWIHTFVPGLPMSNLDHGLINANSLTGMGSIDEALNVLQSDHTPGQAGFFDGVITDTLADAKALLTDLAAAGEANKAEVEESARILARARDAAAPAQRIFDVAVAARVGAIQPDLLFTEDDVRDQAKKSEVTNTVDLLQPAHLPVLFPEVFLRTNPGFDVLLGNPPWEKVKIETDQWWGMQLPGLRSMPQRQKNEALEAFRESRPDLERKFETEKAAVKVLNEAIKKGPFVLGSGDTDLYQAFAWRNWQLLRNGARSGLVLPRGALSGNALSPLRRTVLTEGGFPDVCFIENTGRWAFDMEPRYTIGLVVTAKGGDRVARWAGPFASEKSFRTGAGEVAEVPAVEFASWSRTASFPLIPDPISAKVFRQMKLSPRFDDVREDWEFRPVTDLHATGDKSLMEFDTDESRGRIPILTGASFNLWDPDAGAPYAYSATSNLRSHLEMKLQRAVKSAKSPYKGLKFDEGTLPLDFPRIAFRDVARATDKRTMIACLMPPGTSAAHKAPFLLRRAGDARAEAALLGILSSIPFDWSTRRWVEITMSFEVLNGCPVPRPDSNESLGARLTTIAGRLAAVDERYALWAAEVGVPVGSVKTQAEKDNLLAELDALVSLLYGLSEDQVGHMFATFHRGWDYQPRLEAVLEHYAEWKGRS